MESPFRPDVLKRKVELVTGRGSGICHEIAAELTHHGAQVAIMGRRREVLDKAVDVLRSHGCLLLLPRRILLTPAPPGTPSFSTAAATVVQSSSPTATCNGASRVL
jgi:NAD(P)-dependent dehydrogenase (short-subunit alcohol dehydrogenase family)